MTTIDMSTAIVREITINAPASKIFAALTDPEQLVMWWGEDNLYRCTKMERDLRVGGAWRCTGVNADETPFAVEGVYRTIEPSNVLEYTWCHDWSGTREESIVRFDLEERDGATHLRLTHSGVANMQSRVNQGNGWSRVLGWLTTYVER